MDLQKFVTSKLDRFRQQVANNVVKQATNAFNATPIGQGIQGFQTLQRQAPQIQSFIQPKIQQIQPQLQQFKTNVLNTNLTPLAGPIGAKLPKFTVGNVISNVQGGVKKTIAPYEAQKKLYADYKKTGIMPTRQQIREVDRQMFDSHFNSVVNIGGGSNRKAITELNDKFAKDVFKQVNTNKTQILDSLKRFSAFYEANTSKMPNIEQSKFVRTDLETAFKQIYGNSKGIKIPQNIYDLANAVRRGFKEFRVPELYNIDEGGVGLGIGTIKRKPISAEGFNAKGKLRINNLPTQTEVLNRAEVNAGNPDLYKQRQAKISEPLWESKVPESDALRYGKAQIPETQNIQQLRVQPKTTETLLQKSQTALLKAQGQYKSSPQVPLEDIVRSSGIDVKNKVNIIDNYLRTPDRVLKKIGLEQETDQLRKGYDTYLKELPLEIDKITQWSQRADSADSTVSIFKYLDGQKVNLSQNDLKIAGEVKQYLAGWADRLGLPKEGRIANYITHIFDRDLIQKEFDPELAKILRNKVAGSVYDPFLEKRLGALGYKEDAWQALDAYVKRATRKANLDPTLKLISQKSENFEESQFDYVKKYIARVNMQPTKIDNMIDNTIKQAIGYKLGQRPTAVISRALRQAGYRGALGLNVGSALRNLTQISNTYAKLGEKYTALGYVKMLTNGKEELERVGVLRNEFIQDRTMNATKKFWERTDKGLFFLFETAERINRGSAYFGAKSKGLKQGMNEEQAIEYAKKIVRDTQFSFGSIDTPQILSSDIGKTFGQFQSYNLKQAEFLAEMIKNKEFAGLARYTLASFAMVYTIGELIGIDPIDAIPFSGLVTGEGTKIGQTPAISAVTKLKDAAFAQKDKYGNDLEMGDRVDMAIDAVTPIIPAGVQAKKTIQGLDAAIKGYSESKSGRIQYPINKTPVNTLRAGLFGKSNLPEARAYFDNKTTVLGEKQTEQFKQSGDMQGTYNQFMQERTSNRQENTVREQVRSSGGTGQANGKLFYVKDGEVKSVQLDRAIEMPKLTGNYELDKKLMSKYNSTLTAKKNDITALYELGKLSAEEAEKQLKALTSQKLRAGGGRKAKFKKISVSKIKVPRLKAYKAKKIKVSKIGVKFAKVKYPKVKNLKAKKTA